ncbi:hypothetical protein BJV74DRAFT_881547 [Russula compacta]|nr:hypothetical protein BJV74DRAFT_881547 [Russula compacta]
MTSISHPSDPHNIADHLPLVPRNLFSLRRGKFSTSLREILGAYRSRGDGDREMLMAMLNAKSAEDQRIASVASLHRSMLEYYQISSRQAQEAPYPSAPNPVEPSHQSGAYQSPSPAAPAPHYPSYSRNNDTPSQRSTHAYSHKRIRTSESPQATYRSIPSSYTPSPPPGPSSPYSSRSGSVDQPQPPCSREAITIGSLLTVSARQPRDNADDPLQKPSVHEDRSQLRRQ